MTVIISLLKVYYVLVSILFCISASIGQDTTKQEKQVQSCKDQPILYPKDRKPDTGDPSKRIIGGYDATPHMYPYQVGMYTRGGGYRFFCGGSLITSEYVLTAAHCVLNMVGATVFLGAHDFENKQESSRIIIKAAKFIVHDLYDSNQYEHDIALILLSKKATLNEYIKIIDIDDGDDLHVGSTATCSGWGTTIWVLKSKVLRYADLQIMPNSECNRRFSSTNITENQICGLGENVEGSAEGDSGGPVVINGIQVGIVSFGAGPCYPLRPSVFTRVSKYSSWVYEQTGKRPKNKKGRGGRHAPLMKAWAGIMFCLMFVNYL